MRFFVVELAIVTTSEHVTLFAEVTELTFPTAVVLFIKYVIVLCSIYNFIHSGTVPYGFLKTLPESRF